MLRHLVKRRIYYLAVDRPLHIGDFFRSLVNEQHKQSDFLVVGRDGICYLFEKSRLTCLRRRDYHSSLSFTYRSDEIKTSYSKVASRHASLCGVYLQSQSLFGEYRRKRVKVRTLSEFRQVFAAVAHKAHCLILARAVYIATSLVLLINYLILYLRIYSLDYRKRWRFVVGVALGYTHYVVAGSQSHCLDYPARYVYVLVSAFAVFRSQKSVSVQKL